MQDMSKTLEVSSAVLHGTIEFPGLQSGVSLNKIKYPNLKMEIAGDFLKLEYNNMIGLIPLTNVKFLVIK